MVWSAISTAPSATCWQHASSVDSLQGVLLTAVPSVYDCIPADPVLQCAFHMLCREFCSGQSPCRCDALPPAAGTEYSVKMCQRICLLRRGSQRLFAAPAVNPEPGHSRRPQASAPGDRCRRCPQAASRRRHRRPTARHTGGRFPSLRRPVLCRSGAADWGAFQQVVGPDQMMSCHWSADRSAEVLVHVTPAAAHV